MGQLLLLRHGQSTWNLQNRFTGWVDVPLTPEGVREMEAAGARLRDVPLVMAYTSALRRTIDSARIVLGAAMQPRVETVAAAALNERRYGDLQGLNKSETALRFGAEQVRLWRRSYTERPPGGESLEDASARIVPYFNENILPQAVSCANVLVCAHGNTLRAIRKELDRLTAEQVAQLEIPTGRLYRYRLDSTGAIVEAGQL